MPSLGNNLLAQVIIALGLLGVILSFLVPDRKKSLISLVLAGVIVLSGIYQYSAESIAQYRWNRRIRDMQRERIDFDALRQKMTNKPATTSPNAKPGQSNTQPAPVQKP
jgi:hypothetical protein